MIFVGVDGCPGGWVAAVFNNSNFNWYKVHQISELKNVLDLANIVLLDMPMGLLTKYRPGGRVCDQLARKLLPRHKKSSIFSAPSRSVLNQTDYDNCKRILNSEGGGISLQSFHLLPKILEIDSIVRNCVKINILEAHPELVFQSLGLIDSPSKKSSEGRLARLELLKKQPHKFQWPPPQGYPKEDCLDALALAMRAAQGNLKLVDPNPSIDSYGITMQIHY